ncbi:MAG: hypothetical protein CMO35_11755 [Verrucomicrobiaceae bacterium]|jgi:hypothetical protein|nr:hypothetical protein [Verrucomicrobiaceae bacterium]
MPTSVDRRRFLQGAGLSLALPLMESAAPRAMAATSAKRPRRILAIGNHLGFYPPAFFPEKAGADYVSSQTLKNIERHRKDFTVFSNLDDGAHGGHSGVHAFLSGGIRKEESGGFPEKNISLDQVAAEYSGSTARFPSINAGLGEGTDMCWNRTGVRIPPINNPARLFEALFVERSKSERDLERTRLEHRGSVLDALRESAKSLHGNLSNADRDKLDQYLTSVRDVENRLQMSEVWLDKPKPRPAIAPVTDEDRMHIEELPLFFDLLTLALQTNSTRVATFEIPMGFTTSDLDNVSSGYHGLSHHSKGESKLEQLKVVEDYIFSQIDRLFDGLREARIFNDTLVVIGSGMSDGSTHSNKNLPVLLAGGGLKHQGHIISPADKHRRVPLSNLWLSSLQWFGVERERFGKSTGTFSQMDFS